MGKKFRFPLGGDLYAYVNTRKRDGVKIHIRHFQLSTDTKGGVKPTTKGVKMDAKTLRRLVAIKKQLTDEFKLHFDKDQKSSEKQKKNRKELPETPPLLAREQQKKNRKELSETPPLLAREQQKKNRKELRLELTEMAPLLMSEQEEEIRQQRTWPVAIEKQKKNRKELRLELTETAPLLMPEQEEEIRQQRTWPVLENNYPAAFVDVGALTPSYSYNDP